MLDVAKIGDDEEEISIDEQDLPKLNILIDEQESLNFQNLKKVTINNAFVFYFQLLNPLYHCFTVFIQPSATGKVSIAQIELLNNLENLLHQ